MPDRPFGAGHLFLAEENPARVVELVTETIRDGALAGALGRASVGAGMPAKTTYA